MIPSAPVMIPRTPIFFPPTPITIPPAPVYILSAPAYILPAPVYIPSAPVYILSVPVFIPPAPVYIPSTPVRARVVSVCACRRNVRARRIYLNVPEKISSAPVAFRPRSWLSVRARRRNVRALEHPVRTGINAFALEGLRGTTATCARGTISPRPIAMHSVQSHYT
jgi:hypothetical protein